VAVFPKCSFELVLPGNVLVAGARADVILDLVTQEPIAHSKSVDLHFRSDIWLDHYNPRTRSATTQESAFVTLLKVDVPGGFLPAGRHRFHFALDLPPSLPPSFGRDKCWVEHTLEARLDVDWAIDPVAKFSPAVVMGPVRDVYSPMTGRRAVGSRSNAVLEVVLASDVVAFGEPIEGQIALRGELDAACESIELSLMSRATSPLIYTNYLQWTNASLRIAASALRSGVAVPFQLPGGLGVAPSFGHALLSYDHYLAVKVDLPWSINSTVVEYPLQILPRGSVLDAGAAAGSIGVDRLRMIAAVMAQGSGLETGEPPTLVEGTVECVTVRVTDAPERGELGIDVDFGYPDVELGIELRPRGLLDGRRGRAGLPPGLADHYALNRSPKGARPAVDDAAFEAFAAAALADLGDVRRVRFSDHHLGVHIAVAKDDPTWLVAVARAARARASAIAEAIARLPFPTSVASSRPAWLATAAEQGAFLVPTGPSLHGLTFRVREPGGDERAFGVTLRTLWGPDGPLTRVDVELREAPLPGAAKAEIEGEATSERLRPVRAMFPSARVLGEGQGVVLERPSFTAEPRSLLPALEALFWWVFEARGERRQGSPYR
jgi:Arrestin (or S-antigen), N-terminal domain